MEQVEIGENEQILNVINDQVAKVRVAKDEKIDAGRRGMEFQLLHHEVYPTAIQILEDMEVFDRVDILAREVIDTTEGPLVRVICFGTW